MPYDITNSGFILHRPVAHTSSDYGVSDGRSTYDDARLVPRIASAYRKAIKTYLGSDENFWHHLFGPIKAEIHEALIADDQPRIMSFLRDPGSSALFFGFEALFKGADTSPAWYAAHVRLVYNELLRLCEALGTVKIENPEFFNPAGDPPAVVRADDLLNGIDAALGIRVEFPNPFKESTALLRLEESPRSAQ